MTADDPTGLASLHDIVLPAPTAWWPPAPGWYWVLGLVCLIGSALLLRALVRWQRNCYRREALAELTRIEELARIEAMANNEPPTAKTPNAVLPAMAELLKRTALTAYPRAQVAALTGPAWFAFLDRTGGTRFSAGLGAALAHGNYLTGEGHTAASRTAEIAGEIRCWIRQHGDHTEPEPANDIRPAHQHATDNGQADAA